MYRDAKDSAVGTRISYETVSYLNHVDNKFENNIKWSATETVLLSSDTNF